MGKRSEENRQVTEAAKVEALFRERPFLNKHFSKTRIRSVRVKVADSSILKRATSAQNQGEIGFMVRAYLLNQDGEMIHEVGFRRELEIKGKPNRRWWEILTPEEDVFRVWYNGDSVGEDLEYIGEEAARKVTFVVFTDMYDGSLTLYRPPKGYTLLEWLEKETARAQKELRAELAQ